MTKNIDISVIVINYNTAKLTKKCIESVFIKTKGINVELIVVDNASKDKSVEVLSTLSKKFNIKVIANKENLGFGRGNNQGMRIAKGRYFLLLNTDTLVKDNVLGEMVRFMDKNKDIGLATCALRNTDGSIQGTGGFFPTLPRVFAWMTFLDDLPLLDRIIKPFHPMHGNSPYKGESYFAKRHEQDWITGAFFLGRSELIKSVGYFDDDYFMYVEEVDYCYRVRQLGFKIAYLPKWNIIHYGGASSTKEFPIISEFKGLLIFYSKHKNKSQLAKLRLLLKMGIALRIILFGILKGREVAQTYAKAYREI